MIGELNFKDKADRKKFYNRKQWINLRKERLELDNFECQWCKQEGKVTTHADAVLEVDHIKEIEYYPSLALDIDNLRTLCRSCHNIRHDRLGDRIKSNEERMNLSDVFVEKW